MHWSILPAIAVKKKKKKNRWILTYKNIHIFPMATITLTLIHTFCPTCLDVTNIADKFEQSLPRALRFKTRKKRNLQSFWSNIHHKSTKCKIFCPQEELLLAVRLSSNILPRGKCCNVFSAHLDWVMGLYLALYVDCLHQKEKSQSC